MAKKKEYRLEVSGLCSTDPRFHFPPEEVIEDMLRYDNGRLEEVTSIESIEGSKARQRFTAIVVSKYYTPDRWRSFGIRTRVIN